MNNIISKPDIHFKDIETEWKTWKIGDVLTEKNRSILVEDEKEYQLITVKRRNEGVVSRGYLKGKNILVKNYFEVEEGDFVISKRQIIHGANGIIPHSLNNAVVSNEYLVATSNENITTEYWSLISKLPNMYKQFFLSSYGVDIEKLVFDVRDWKKRTITIPDIYEQKRITNFYKDLDKLISFCQTKINKLIVLKSSMLDKMIPKFGEDLPEIRFKGSNEKWVKYSLGEIAPIRGGFAFKSNNFRKSGVPILKISNILSSGEVGGRFDYYDELVQEERFILQNNSAVIAMSGATTGKVSILNIENNKKVYQNQRVGYFEDKGVVDYTFISTILRSELFSNKMKSVLVAGAQPNVSPKEIDSFEFYIPKSKEEQEKIGNYFKTIDQVIKNHKTQVVKLSNIKKGCLSKMFI